MEASLPRNQNVFDMVFDPAAGDLKNWRGVYNYLNEQQKSNRQKRNLMTLTIKT